MFRKIVFTTFVLSSFSVISHASFEQDAQSTACDPKKLAEIQKLITPDLGLNGEVVTSLLEKAQAGTAKCEAKSTKLTINGTWGTCGMAYPAFVHQLTISGDKQAVTMFIREDKIDCGGVGYWLTSLSSGTGDISSVISSGDKIVGQAKGSSCAIAADYKAVTFSYQNEGQTIKAAKILNVNGGSCSAGDDALIQFSAKSLGLSAEDLAYLQQQ